MTKEQYFLEFNKGNIATDLIQAEVHFRRVKKTGGSDVKGHQNCCVKHLLHASGESQEAISHALVVANPGVSHNFRSLASNIDDFRKRLQTENVSPDEGILAVRKLRGEFESFNPDFDVSKCQSCGSMGDFGDLIKDANNLNMQSDNYAIVGKRMASKNNISGKDMAILYGGQWVGLGVNQAIDMAVPQYGLAAKLIGAIALPLLSYYVRMNKTVAQVLVLTGGYLSTKLVDYAGQYIPAARVQTRNVAVVRRQVPVYPVGPISSSQSKYVLV